MQLTVKLDEKDRRALVNARLPEQVGFGDLILPIMTITRYRNGEWQTTELRPYEDIKISPSCKGMHYGQTIFEGLKAYSNLHSSSANVFCLRQHWQRLNSSASELGMPTIPEEVFSKAVTALVSRAKNFIPTVLGDALYIRPFMFSSASGLGLANNNEFEFYIIASPSQAYFNEPLKVLIERQRYRAFKGGTGMIKMAGNYGQIFTSMQRAKEKGCGLSLWLDADTGKYVEEFSAMNFFAVRKGVLFTPPLLGTILPGVTRSAVISLAQDLGIECVEEAIAIDELLGEIKSGECEEVFASGTGATITPISEIKDEDGSSYVISKFDVSLKIKEYLQQIHHGLKKSPIEGSCTEVNFIDMENKF
ncbi:branched-chain amino acid aminotransferase [Pseudoalteromonas piscicida]|uniref:Branched-chain-amino-acid aminotransferase n=1 Tax=Pseudoalteromonas piscicida TaxID=43662 RepID=A0A2A5JMQ9_PSEO7|nr:branched-chain amino acid aminotransferase [Pseudoalteromonas piscicida]PCK30716.1 branched chain amino acid aminotransferase [Pseudoalteromonas piscicida]